MPVAVNVSKQDRFDLKSLPEGFVVLQRMNYGDSVARRAMMKLSFTSGGSNRQEFQGELAMASVDIQQFEFQTCIVDHNLTDENETKLNLNLVSDMVKLDPRVGQEIEELISKMNNFDADSTEGNSQNGASQS